MAEEINPIDYSEEGEFPKGMTEFAEMMVEDEKNIPAAIRSKWWGFLGKDTILTRSNSNDDIWEAQNDFAIRKNHHLMSQPYYKNDINEMVDIDNTRRRFTSQHRRSIDGFERQALMTQIRELRTNKVATESGSGFWDSVKGKLGFKAKKEGGNYAGS